MSKNKLFKENQVVKFTKKTLVYDLDNKSEFFVSENTTGKVIIDEDVGEIGSIKIKLNKKDGKSIIIETNDEFLKEIK